MILLGPLFLFLHENMLWVLISSTSVRCVLWVHKTYIFMQNWRIYLKIILKYSLNKSFVYTRKIPEN